MREARERAIPARYRDTLAALRDPEFAGDEVALDHLGLTDAEFGPLFEALKGHAGVREVSLRGNAFTNVSLQVLVAGVAAGALPNLRRLALAGNGFSDMAATMASVRSAAASSRGRPQSAKRSGAGAAVSTGATGGGAGAIGGVPAKAGLSK